MELEHYGCPTCRKQSQRVDRRRCGQQAPPSTSFYRAMLCIRGASHGPVSVCLSVCLSVRLSVCQSQVGVLLKRLNVGSRKQQHTIVQGL